MCEIGGGAGQILFLSKRPALRQRQVGAGFSKEQYALLTFGKFLQVVALKTTLMAIKTTFMAIKTTFMAFLCI